MAKNFKKGLSAALAALMCAGTMSTAAMAAQTINGTTWTPNGVYAPMTSNYEVTYCCDIETMIVDGTYYKRVNLDDSEYYTAEQAAKIRAIVTNSYPHVTLEAMNGLVNICAVEKYPKSHAATPSMNTAHIFAGGSPCGLKLFTRMVL